MNQNSKGPARGLPNWLQTILIGLGVSLPAVALVVFLIARAAPSDPMPPSDPGDTSPVPVPGATADGPGNGLPGYRIVQDDLDDWAPNLFWNVVLDAPADKDGLTKLINHLYPLAQRELAQRGQPNPNPPGDVSICIYPTIEHMLGDEASWCAKWFSNNGAEPRISYRKPPFFPDTSEEIKNGRTTAERIGIWHEHIRMQDRVMREVYPASGLTIEERVALEERLEDKYEAELFARHGLSAEELIEIHREADRKYWPRPVLPNSN